ncbi:uncharacterized protein LOC120857677 [Oryx dammah]|uniref:uncharacterized protein LOC120857677 n=1 Tax=Oryx dammah TaxID=59534 RepID=UPI001A9B56AC|nr:uncharacterized protein LOC120857677 [Oryx dammah]
MNLQGCPVLLDNQHKPPPYLDSGQPARLALQAHGPQLHSRPTCPPPMLSHPPKASYSLSATLSPWCSQASSTLTRIPCCVEARSGSRGREPSGLEPKEQSSCELSPGVGRGGGPGGGPGRGRRLTPGRTRAPSRRQYASRLERCGRRRRHHPPPLPPPDAREEMYQARPLSRNLFLYTFLQNHGPGFLDDQDSGLPGVTSILEVHPISPYSDSPHYLAMQLASIADEMELRLLLPQFVEPFWMTMYSLFFPYSHVGLRDVLRSFMVAFTNLRENRRLWSFLTLRDQVSPGLWPELALSLLVVAMLSWGYRLH